MTQRESRVAAPEETQPTPISKCSSLMSKGVRVDCEPGQFNLPHEYGTYGGRV